MISSWFILFVFHTRKCFVLFYWSFNIRFIYSSISVVNTKIYNTQIGWNNKFDVPKDSCLCGHSILIKKNTNKKDITYNCLSIWNKMSSLVKISINKLNVSFFFTSFEYIFGFSEAQKQPMIIIWNSMSKRKKNEII
jgi:hypothetical protein